MFNNANTIFRTKFVDGVSTVTRTVPALKDKADNAANEKGPGAAGGSTEASKRRKMKTGALGSKENV